MTVTARKYRWLWWMLLVQLSQPACERTRLILAADKTVVEFLFALNNGDRARLSQTTTRDFSVRGGPLEMRVEQFLRELGGITDHLRIGQRVSADGTIVLDYRIRGAFRDASLTFMVVPTDAGWRIDDLLKTTAF